MNIIRRLKYFKPTLVILLVSSLVTWLTMLCIVITGVYKMNFVSFMKFTLKLIMTYVALSFTADCVKTGGCHKYYAFLILSGISLSTWTVLTV